jgi:hypothetical protein
MEQSSMPQAHEIHGRIAALISSRNVCDDLAYNGIRQGSMGFGSHAQGKGDCPSIPVARAYREQAQKLSACTRKQQTLFALIADRYEALFPGSEV